MALRLESLRVDEKRLNEGDWIEIPDWPGTEFKCRGLGYGPYSAAVSAMRGRWERKYGSVAATPDNISSPDLGRLLARHILIDWRGIVEPFDRAEEFLTENSPFGLTVRAAVLYAAGKISEVEAEFVEDAAKNSGRSSGGSSKAVAAPPTGSPT